MKSPHSSPGGTPPIRDPLSDAFAPGGRRWLPVLLVVGAWLAVGLLSAGPHYLAARSQGQPGMLLAQLRRELPPWQVWSLLTPVVFALSRRFPVSSGSLLRSLPVHALAATACSLLYLAAYSAWLPIAMPEYESPFGLVMSGIFRARMNVAIILYVGLVVVEHAIRHFRELRIREVETARAQTESARALAEAAEARAGLARARLLALRSQLHPHFLFNTLHSIASLMDEDVPTARRLIARLSDLFRTTLEVGEAPEVRLADEIALLERYLDIEQVRYGARLRVRWEVGPGTGEALVPPLLLQPLVENAVRHGVGPLEEGGVVCIRAAREGDHLALEVADDGRGARVPGAPEEGNGLRITRERLEHMYGRGQEMGFPSNGSRGFTVSIRLPYREGATK